MRAFLCHLGVWLCAGTFTVVAPAPIPAPLTLAQLWRDNAECSGITVPLPPLQFFQTTAITEGSAERWGLWLPPNRIYLRIDHVTDVKLLRHELLHAALQDGSHASAAFARCDLLYGNETS